MPLSLTQYPVSISSSGRGKAVSVQWTDWRQVKPRIYPTPGDAALALGWSEDLAIEAIDQTATLHTYTSISYDEIGKQSIQGLQHIKSSTSQASDDSDHEMDQSDNSTRGSQSPDPNPANQQQGSKTEEWQPVPGTTYVSGASRRGNPLYVRLVGDYDEPFTLGSLPPGTMQKDNGKFLKFPSERGVRPWAGTITSLPRGRGSIHYLLREEMKIKVVISREEETCKEDGAKLPGKKMYKKPDKDIWTNLVPAVPRECLQDG